MENRVKKPIIGFVILAIIGCGGFFWYSINSAKNIVEQATENVTDLRVKDDIYKKISEPKDFGQSISPDEAGFGRDNPFAPYK